MSTIEHDHAAHEARHVVACWFFDGLRPPISVSVATRPRRGSWGPVGRDHSLPRPWSSRWSVGWVIPAFPRERSGPSHGPCREDAPEGIGVLVPRAGADPAAGTRPPARSQRGWSPSPRSGRRWSWSPARLRSLLTSTPRDWRSCVKQPASPNHNPKERWQHDPSEWMTVKAASTVTDQGRFSAIAAAWSVDRVGDQIVRGAFDTTIKSWQKSASRSLSTGITRVKQRT